MKIIIASDLHGSFYYASKLIERFNQINADKLVLLGDILYHGPRNDLPRDYNPKKVVELLNSLKDKIICVKGNCDAEVDQMVLNFNLSTANKKVKIDCKVWHLTHGHKFNPQNPKPATAGEIVLFGHSHIPFDDVINGVRYLNPGSTSIPKQNSAHSFILYNNGEFIFETL